MNLAEKLAKTKKPAPVLERIVERIAFLTIELETAKPMIDELEMLKKALVNYAEDSYEAEDEVRFDSDDVEIVISQKDVVRKIKNMGALFAKLGKEKFLAAVSFPMKQIDVLFTKEEQKKFISRKRIGARSCKITVI